MRRLRLLAVVACVALSAATTGCAWTYPPRNKLGPAERPHPTPEAIRALLGAPSRPVAASSVPIEWIHPKRTVVIGAADIAIQVRIEAHADNRAFVLSVQQDDMQIHGWAKSLNGANDDTLLPPAGRVLPSFRLTQGVYELRATVLGARGVVRASTSMKFTVCAFGEGCGQ